MSLRRLVEDDRESGLFRVHRAAFLDVGAAPAPAATDHDDLAAMAVVASLVLNLDEVLCLP